VWPFADEESPKRKYRQDSFSCLENVEIDPRKNFHSSKIRIKLFYQIFQKRKFFPKIKLIYFYRRQKSRKIAIIQKDLPNFTITSFFGDLDSLQKFLLGLMKF